MAALATGRETPLPTGRVVSVTPSAPRSTATPQEAVAPLPSPSPSSTPAATPTPTPCAATVCVVAGHFVLERPIAPPGQDAITAYYPFGSTGNGRYEPHHGVEFLNPGGTPVRAAAAGIVRFAGWDDAAQLGPWPFFYGQVVLLEHTLPWGRVYTLYAHLSAVEVQVGQTVQAGERLGAVGHTGSAVGDHLHFEVRTSPWDYNAVQNPVLWLRLRPGTGALAVRLTDPQGQPLHLRLTLTPLDPAGPPQYLETYADPALQGDPLWGENLALADLPPGRYRLAVVALGRLHERTVTVQAGYLTLVRWSLTP